MTTLQSVINILGYVLQFFVIVIRAMCSYLIPTRYKLKNISGEIALITGSGSGLGRLLSLRLAELGAIVVVWDVNEAGIDETVKQVRAAGGQCHGYVCNLCNREEVYKKAEIVRKDVGQVSILVNNAGIVIGKKFIDTPDEQIIKTMEVNTMAHFWTVKAFLPAMMKSNKGHIVNIASLAGHVGVTKLVDYCASKFAAVGFDEALRMELESSGYDNIFTTVICPYFIRSTGMFQDVQSRFPTLSSEEVAERVIVAMRTNEKFAIIPGYFQILLACKWIFPWPCAAMVLRGLVKDASPGLANSQSKSTSEIMKEQSAMEQLPRRQSNSERKP